MAVGRRARAPGFRWLPNRYLRATPVFDQRLPGGAGLLSLQGIVRRGYALGGVRSLICSLIQLRPEGFGVHHSARIAQVADPLEPRWTQPHKLGKRVGTAVRSRPAREQPSDEVRNTHGRPAAGQACCGSGRPPRARLLKICV